MALIDRDCQTSALRMLLTGSRIRSATHTVGLATILWREARRPYYLRVSIAWRVKSFGDISCGSMARRRHKSKAERPARIKDALDTLRELAEARGQKSARIRPPPTGSAEHRYAV